MKEILEKRICNQSLTKDEAKNTLLDIGQGKCNSHQVAAFLTTYMMRAITVDELSGFRAALLDLCVAIDLSDYDSIDLCGTGGDGKDTFNISTLSSFVTAGAGVPVAKHGNYAASSKSGAANVLKELSVNIECDINIVSKCLNEVGICFLFAPKHHTAMKYVGKIRQELGIRTIFNLLGPLSNPAFVKKQLVQKNYYF